MPAAIGSALRSLSRVSIHVILGFVGHCVLIQKSFRKYFQLSNLSEEEAMHVIACVLPREGVI